MKDTIPTRNLSIGDLIVDEFLRMNVRPDWQPGRAPLDPDDFRTRNNIDWQLATAPVRLGVK